MMKVMKMMMIWKESQSILLSLFTS